MSENAPCETLAGTWDAPEGVDVTPTADLRQLVAPDWAAVLEPVAPTLTHLGEFLRAEVTAGRGYLPRGDQILRAFSAPLDHVRVLIVGQDPYPTPGHAVGLSFAVDARVRPLPPSLVNIYRELAADLGVQPPDHGDLSSWSQRGVLLLNRSLTVRPGQPGSHRGKGWERITDTAIEALSNRGGPLVAILWGRDAQSLRPVLGDVPVITSPHPSPLSATRGFFGSRPFSRANRLLIEQGGEPIDWSVAAWQS
jgi:uracil-DNA glycosylase